MQCSSNSRGRRCFVRDASCRVRCLGDCVRLRASPPPRPTPRGVGYYPVGMPVCMRCGGVFLFVISEFMVYILIYLFLGVPVCICVSACFLFVISGLYTYLFLYLFILLTDYPNNNF